MNNTDIKVHPAANIFPMMSEQEYAGLLEDVRENGVKTFLCFRGESTDDAELIDGRNRLKAILELGLDYLDYADIVHPNDMPDPVQHVLSLNLHRRHLDTSQRAMVAANVATLIKGSNQHKKEDSGNHLCSSASISTAAEALHVSEDSVKSARKVKSKGIQELSDAVVNGEVSVSKAAKIAELPKPEQAKAIIKAKEPRPPRQKPQPKPVVQEREAPAVEVPFVPHSQSPNVLKKPEPIGELRKIFDDMGKPEEAAVDRFAEWCLKQNDIETIHAGCAVWTEWE